MEHVSWRRRIVFPTATFTHGTSSTYSLKYSQHSSCNTESDPCKNWKKSELNMVEQASPISLKTLQLQNFTHSLLHRHHAKVQMRVVFSGGLWKFIQEPQLWHLDLQTWSQQAHQRHLDPHPLCTHFLLNSPVGHHKAMLNPQTPLPKEFLCNGLFPDKPVMFKAF
jgi:hypothetical protein